MYHWPPVEKRLHYGVFIMMEGMWTSANEWSELVWINIKNSVDRQKPNHRIVFTLYLPCFRKHPKQWYALFSSNLWQCLPLRTKGWRWMGPRRKKMGGCQFYLHCVSIFKKKSEIYAIDPWTTLGLWVLTPISSAVKNLHITFDSLKTHY